MSRANQYVPIPTGPELSTELRPKRCIEDREQTAKVGIMRQLIRTGGATVLLAGWLLISVFFVLALGLMSVDEEWEGWSDLLPLVLIYVVLTAIVWVIMWILVRTRGDS